MKISEFCLKYSLTIVLLLTVLFCFSLSPVPVSAGYQSHEQSSYNLTKNLQRIENAISPIPVMESTPVPIPQNSPVNAPTAEEGNNFGISWVFDKIIDWVFGNNLYDLANTSDLTEEQRQEIENYSGESNPINLIRNFCLNAKSDDFGNMIQSLRENNPDLNNGTPPPAILLNFFEKIGSLCPDE
jgi:hypothetical protein